MIVADASFWVNSLLPHEVNFDSSRRFAGMWVSGSRPISIPALFLPEVAGVLSRKGTLQEMTSNDLYQTLSSPFFVHHPIDSRLERRSAEIAHSFKLRGADAVYVALADQLSLPLVTWDNEQLERGGQVVHALTPEQALKELL